MYISFSSNVKIITHTSSGMGVGGVKDKSQHFVKDLSSGIVAMFAGIRGQMLTHKVMARINVTQF